MGVGRASGPLLRAHGSAATAPDAAPDVGGRAASPGRNACPTTQLAVTFDDGYVDNVSARDRGWPRRACRRRSFWSPTHIGQAREFWWDEVARGILGRREALDCEIPVNGGLCRLTFPAASGSEDDLQANKSWRAWQSRAQPVSGRSSISGADCATQRAAARDEAMNRFRRGRESAGRGSHRPADGAWRCRAARTRWPVRDRRAYAHASASCRCSRQKSAGARSKKASDVANSWRAVKCAGLHTRTELWTTIVVPLCARAASRGRARPSPGPCSDRPTRTRCRACSSQDWDAATFAAALT